MTRQLSYETVLLDVDGTLIDSNGAHANAWTKSLHEHHVKAELDQVRRLIGMGGDKLLPAVAHVREDSELGKAIAHRKKEIFESLLPELQPTAGARSFVEFLRQRHRNIVIATSADDRELRSLLKRAGVDDLIPQRTSKDDAPQSKPDPDIVHAAMTHSGARAESTVMVGDTPYDIEAAHRAGIGAIALRCGGYWGDRDLKDALDIFDDPAALLAQWQKI